MSWAAGTPAALVLVGAGLLMVPAAGPTWQPRRRGSRKPRVSPRARQAALAGCGMAAVALLLDLSGWLAAGLVAAAGATSWRFAARAALGPAADPRRLAAMCDLLAACLESGLAMGQAISAVLVADRDDARASGSSPGVERAGFAGPAVPTGPGDSKGVLAVAAATGRAVPGRQGAGDVLAEVAALLALGATPDAAWRPAEAHPDLAQLAAAARRSALGGVRIADAVRDVAADLRAGARVAAERSAARAGIAMTAPLAICFLPAFVCLGLAPVVIGLIGSLHIFG